MICISFGLDFGEVVRLIDVYYLLFLIYFSHQSSSSIAIPFNLPYVAKVAFLVALCSIGCLYPSSTCSEFSTPSWFAAFFLCAFLRFMHVVCYPFWLISNHAKHPLLIKCPSYSSFVVFKYRSCLPHKWNRECGFFSLLKCIIKRTYM